MKQTDKMISAIQQDIELPAVVTRKAQEAFQQILMEGGKETKEMESSVHKISHTATDQVRSNQLKPYASHRRRGEKRLPAAAKTAAAVAAILLLSFGLCAANPVLAAKIPIIGRLFSMLQGSLEYPGDYTDYTQPLEETPPVSEDADSSFSQTVNGVTVTLSEIYCNQEAMSLSMMIQAPEPFRDQIATTLEGTYLSLEASSRFSFRPEPYVGNNSLTGSFIDDKTFIGVWRVDMQELLLDESQIIELSRQAQQEGREFPITPEVIDQYGIRLDLPKQFTLQLDLARIVGNLANPVPLDYGMSAEELESLSDQEFQELHARVTSQAGMEQYPNTSEHYWFDGPWSFSIPVTVNATENKDIPVHDFNDAGIGLESLLLTPFELRVNARMEGGDYIPILLDAQGKWMDPGSGDVSILPISGHDVSEVTVYLCDFTLWYDEVKAYRDQPSLKDYLEQYSSYRRTVTLSR